MEQVRDRALAFAASHAPDLPGFLGEHVTDWHIVDSTTIKLADELRDFFPGAGDHAALKIHKRLSVGIGNGSHMSNPPRGGVVSVMLADDERRPSIHPGPAVTARATRTGARS